MRKVIAKSDSTSCASVDETLNWWRAHYKTILNHAPADTCLDLDTRSDPATSSPDIREDEPTLDEVQKAIRKLKNGRAARPDGIPLELLKYAEEPVSRALHELFHKVWTAGRVPIKWKEGVIVSLYKGNGACNQCSSYRPILPIGSGESIHPRPAEQTGATTNENLALTTIRFHEAKINY